MGKQEELADECKKRGFPSPVYNITSDRRGGRTAWSCGVTVNNSTVNARYWYDGAHVNDAKNDAADVAMIMLRNPAITQEPGPRGR